MNRRFWTKLRQAAEERIALSTTKDEALKNAILATEFYMKAVKQASNASERERLKSKCMTILSRAEEIKQMESWTMARKQDEQERAWKHLKAPLSRRALSADEEVILLEGSRLHGLTFPPWTSEPSQEAFENTNGGVLYVYACLFWTDQLPCSTN